MQVLFSFPVEIWRESILAFLTLKDIAKAFNAFVNREVQKQFRALTDGHTVVTPVSIANSQKEFLKWCLNRNILPEQVMLWDKYDSQMKFLVSQVSCRATKLSFGFWERISEPIHCSRLYSLDLYQCSFASLENLLISVPATLANISLTLCSKLTTPAVKKGLTLCTNLKRCSIGDCALITDEAIAFILKQCTKLESLYLRGVYAQPVFGRQTQQFNLTNILQECANQRLPSLRTVEISGCTVCSAGLQQLAACAPLLTALKLHGTGANIYNSDVVSLVQHCPHLIDLALDHCTHLSNAAIDAIVSYLPSTKQLSIAYCVNITDEGIITIANSLPHLEYLNLSYCEKITDVAIQHVWHKCSVLVHLSIAGCTTMTDAAFDGKTSTVLRALTISNTNLTGSFYQYTCHITELYCSNCPFLNSDFLRALETYGCQINALFLCGTRLSVEELQQLSLHLPLLERVRIADSAANDAVVRSFADNCPRLRWINVMGCTAVMTGFVSQLTQTRQITISR